MATSPTDTLTMIESINATAWTRAIIIIAAGYLFAKFISARINTFVLKHGSAQQAMLIRRVSFYGLLTLFLFAGLQQLGFKMSVLLGTAGFITIAIGFASQTSVSNLIAALFLIAERPFVLGNVIKVGAFTGEVISIDALSIKLKTPDNQFVRIPNNKLLNVEIVNLSRYRDGRLDLKITLSKKEDVENAEKTLLEIANEEDLISKKPAPQLGITGYTDNTVGVQFYVWTTRKNLTPLSNRLQKSARHALEKAGIDVKSLSSEYTDSQ